MYSIDDMRDAEWDYERDEILAEYDPDDAADPNDKKVTDLLNQIDAAVNELAQAQGIDVAGEPTKPPTPADDDTKPTDQGDGLPTPKPTPNPAAVPDAKMRTDGDQMTYAAPAVVPVKTPDGPINPVNTEGDVEPTAVCATPGCGHMASAHQDTDTGENTGPCQMANCECPGMTFASNQGQQVSDTPAATPDGGGPDNAVGDDDGVPGKMALAEPVPDTAQAPETAEAVTPDEEANEPPAVTGGTNVGPAFSIPVAIIEGQPTGDGREIAPMALSWGPPPYALMGLATSTHDPMGMDQNDPAVIVGRIDSFERQAGESGTQVIVGQGNFFSNDDGMYFADMLEQMGRLPVSGDVLVVESEITGGEMDADGFPSAISETLTKGVLQAVTILPFKPAFAGAYICLAGAEPKEPIPVAGPQATTASIHWMTERECEPCMEGLEVIAAAGGPTRPPKAWFEDPNFTEDDGRLLPFIAQGPGGRMITGYACPPTVTEDGEYFGHLAPWGTCHIGERGKCVVAPHSKSNYAFFKRGHIVTAEGDPVRVGVVTAGTGHADLRSEWSDAARHYDHTGLQAAVVNTGEDDYGIWFHGALRPSVTEEQIQLLRSSAHSGDWRDIGGQYEMVGDLVVNVPGFAPGFISEIEEVHAFAAAGQVTAIVAAGAWAMLTLMNPRSVKPTKEDMALAMELAYEPMIRIAEKDANERLAVVASAAITDARERIDALR